MDIALKPQYFIPRLAGILVIVFSFEEFVYGRISLSPMPYILAKTLSELLLYAIVMLIILWRMQSASIEPYHPTAFDISIVMFVIVAILSTIYNDGQITRALFDIRTMLRYLTIYYAIVLTSIKTEEWQIRKFIKVIVILAMIQSVLAVVQHFGGNDFTIKYFSPLKSEADIGVIRVVVGSITQKLGAAIGTFGKTPSLALFLMLAAVFVLALALEKPDNISGKWLVAYIFIVVAIFYTYKRGPLLLVLFAPLLVAWLMRNKQFARRYIVASFLVMPILATIVFVGKSDKEFVREKKVEISPVQSFSQLFMEEYWRRTIASSRGWVILEVGSEAILSFRPVGYGADELHAQELLSAKGGEFSKLVGWGALNDVYVVAGLVYYGPIGVALLFSCFHYIYQRSRRLADHGEGIYRLLGVSVCALLILTFLASFLVRTLEFRAYVFCIWFLSGLVVVKERMQRRELKTGSDEISGLDKSEIH